LLGIASLLAKKLGEARSSMRTFIDMKCIYEQMIMLYCSLPEKCPWTESSETRALWPPLEQTPQMAARDETDLNFPVRARLLP
jgi:hypothetical protein